MQTVYSAANSLEAHMIVGMLQQQGIVAHVLGEHLQSAAGELPLAGLVRVQVNDEDHERALQIVRAWEMAQPVAAPVPGRSRQILAPVLTFVAGCVLTGLVFNHSSENALDYNGDGIADEHDYYVQDVISRVENDRNHDGKIDEIYFYDKAGRLQRQESDDDFNGYFESKGEFAAGQPVSWTQDFDQNGVIDTRGSMPTASIEYIEVLNEKTGAVLRKSRLCLGRLSAELVDSDNDGKLDRADIYNPLGDIVSTSSDLDAAMNLACPPT
jgi:hypothetical protein